MATKEKNKKVIRQLSLVLVVCFALLLMAFVPILMEYTVIENGLKVSGEGGTATPVIVVNRTGTPGVGSVAQFQINGTPVANVGGNGVSGVGQSDFWRYQDVAQQPTIFTEAGVVSTTLTITSGNFLGIETPRNAVLTFTTVTTATAANITLNGINARGLSQSETLAIAAISGTQTITGVVPWQDVLTMTLPSRTYAITLTVYGGQKFGLPRLPSAASDLYHLTVNATPQTAPTVNTTYGSFDPVSTPASGVDYNVWMK